MSNSSDVILYTQPSCNWCNILAKKLEEAEIEYTKVDITTNGTAKNFIKAEGHKTVPQLYYKHHKINTIDTRDISVNFLKNTLSLYKEQKEDWPWQDSGIEQF
mgnify:CR=1 FL=1|jgi:glutaredoxin